MTRKENVIVPESGTKQKKNIAKKLFWIILRTVRNAFMGMGVLCMLGIIEIYKNSQMQAEMIITSAQAIEIANAEICIFISLLMGSVVFEISMETKKAGR